MKDALRQVVSMLPDTALVGMVTFGAHVNVHELGFQHCAKQYCFRGDKFPQPEEVRHAAEGNPPGSGCLEGCGCGCVCWLGLRAKVRATGRDAVWRNDQGSGGLSPPRESVTCGRGHEKATEEQWQEGKKQTGSQAMTSTQRAKPALFGYRGVDSVRVPSHRVDAKQHFATRSAGTQVAWA